MFKELQELYFSFGEETQIKTRFCNSGLKDNWEKLFFKPLRWIIGKTTFTPEDVDEILKDYKLENIMKDGVIIEKETIYDWLSFLENNLKENPFKTKEDFLDKYFKNDEEFTTFYSFLSYLSTLEEKKTHNGYIKLIIKE